MTFIFDYVWNPSNKRKPINIHKHFNDDFYVVGKCNYFVNTPVDLTKYTELKRTDVGLVTAHSPFSYKRTHGKMDKQ